ncbi:MAG: hypothetical protein GX775_07225 [Erysipelothrix sp.]|nr:hypothetical protein [Erysipelothrix sp.]
MKRIFYFMIIALLLSGCTQSLSQSERVSLENYESYYKITLNEREPKRSSDYFSIEGMLSPIEGGLFRYDIFIDSPQIAMRDVTVMIIENDIAFEDQSQMMPSIGIFDSRVNLYPNQVDTSLNYFKGINLNREIEEDSVTLRVLVEFTNATRDESYHEIIEMKLSNP